MQEKLYLPTEMNESAEANGKETEFVILQKRQMYQDFNFWSEDNDLLHFEFESDSITRSDMRRFREYEAVTSRSCKVPVITYVICSSRVKKLRNSLTEGINTYRVRIIRLKNWDADQVFEKLMVKYRKGEKISEKDLIPMLLTPLMSGHMELKERFKQGFSIFKYRNLKISKEDSERMQSVLYAFALKFLKGKELAEIKEEISMSALGKMIYEDGKAEGKREGIKEGIREGIKEGIKEGKAEGIKDGVKGTIRILVDIGVSRENALHKIKEQFSLSEEETAEYMQLYWG